MHYPAARLTGSVATPEFGPRERRLGVTTAAAPPARSAPPAWTARRPGVIPAPAEPAAPPPPHPLGAFDAFARSFEAELEARIRALESDRDDEPDAFVLPM